ncbi:DUF397 domain-containing protein [Marinactinospora thermotolerans]|uniref:DUF397 domain-containing protein n=1 Tax=Marinactinospora thermotolerans DSM 45154 TaxID=1122192 RepID=A0A1T4TD94_9ACTN|nr:DUF397 domain-containing protein [Marinactinospora thermotolerans]SKA38474.1 protein of unknown function [Marinactinospora thermotolerans DSM 45154]
MNAGEIGHGVLRWHTSSYSSGNGGNCVEVAECGDAVLVRDTRHRELGHLGFAPAEWTAFLAGLKNRHM